LEKCHVCGKERERFRDRFNGDHPSTGPDQIGEPFGVLAHVCAHVDDPVARREQGGQQFVLGNGCSKHPATDLAVKMVASQLLLPGEGQARSQTFQEIRQW